MLKAALFGSRGPNDLLTLLFYQVDMSFNLRANEHFRQNTFPDDW
jgi:hypothetical protein